MQREDYRATLIVMSGLTAASLTAYVRQAAIAHELGVARAADTFLVAFAVPEFVLIALPIVLGSSLIPLLAEKRQREGEQSAWHLGLSSAGGLLAALLVLTAAASFGAPLYLRALAPGFSPQELAVATRATRLMMPGVALMGLAALVGASLQVYRRFARPAFSTAIYNLVFVISLLALPIAQAIDRAALSVTLGAAAALLVQVPLLWAHRPAPVRRLTLQRWGADLAAVARIAGPIVLGYSAHHLILFVDRAMATGMGSGSAAALSYAYHLALVIGQLSGLAVSTAVFPRLSEQIATGETEEARKRLSAALRIVWLVGLPASVGLVILRVPAVRLLFERGAFDELATAAVASPLAWYALAVLADALCQPLWRVIYAQRTSWTVLGINGLQTVVRLVGNIVLGGWMGYNGLALSAALGLLLQGALLGVLVHRRLGPYLTCVWWKDAARVALACGAAALASGGVLIRLSNLAAPGQLLVGGALGTGIYVAALCLLSAARRTRTDE